LPATSLIVDLIRWVLPDLSRLDWREWSMYQLAPGAETVFWSVTMAVAYIVLLLVVPACCWPDGSFPDAAFAECDDVCLTGCSCRRSSMAGTAAFVRAAARRLRRNC
jgi:hypothetical protein